MSKQVIYLKQTSSYDDILKKEYKKMPIYLKKLIFLYKNIFNIVTREKIESEDIWILPIKEEYSLNKLKKILQKNLNIKGNIYLVSKELKDSKICLILDELNIEYITEGRIKKVLIFESLKYIAKLQNKEISDLEATVLVNNTSDINMYLLGELAKKVKTLKIVSLNIYKFKDLEEKLYNEYGIPIQFSNSYRKSLEKSKLIINFDFNEFEINEYKIFDKAIIVNCIRDNVIIKKRLFNGIIINSYDIDYKKELINKFDKMKVNEHYTTLMLYASIIQEKNMLEVYKNIEENDVFITSLIGNNGVIHKREIKEKAKILFRS